MSMAFRGQPQYAQSPMGGYNMSGYGGDAMQAFGDIGGFGGFGALSGPATMGGNYSMFGSYNPMPYQQQSYTGGYVPGYGAQLPQQFGGFQTGFSNFGGYGGGFGMPQMQQPNVNDLFGQYMFGQYYGQPAFNPFQATSMFGGQRGRGGIGGGFGGARRGSRQQLQPPSAGAPSRPNTPVIYDTMPVRPRDIVETPTPAPVPQVTADSFYQDLKRSNPSADDAMLRRVAEERFVASKGTASPAVQPAQPTPSTPNLYDTSNDDWGRGEGPIDASQLPGGFNWQAYLDAPSNADLRAAGVDTPSEAARHYLKYGRNENRSLGAASAAPAVPQSPVPYAQPNFEMPINVRDAGVEQFMPYGQSQQVPSYTQPLDQSLFTAAQPNFGAFPMFVDNYSGLYGNRFNFS